MMWNILNHFHFIILEIDVIISEYTKGVIIIGNSKKDRQHNGQTEKDKKTNNDLQNIHIKLKIE
jgi:hypothetical protein